METAFNNAVIATDAADLAEIHDPDINLVVYAGEIISEQAHTYLNAVDLDNDFLHFPLMDDYRWERPLFTAHIVPEKAGIEEATVNILSKMQKFPNTDQAVALAGTVLSAAQIYTRATGFTDLSINMRIKYPKEQALWHRDNNTDMRGFITLKGDKGSGTLWRPNETVESWELPVDEHGVPLNNFGWVGQNTNGWMGKPFNEYAQNIERYQLGIWKGDYHDKPLIHAEPTIDRSTAPRLVLQIDPKR